MPTVEELQHVEQWWGHILDLLNQADTALQQVHAAVEQFQPDHANPHYLMEAIGAVQHNIHTATDAHNDFLGRLREAQQQAHENQGHEGQEHEGQEQIPDNPY